ncbi:hypothetical protein ABEB36_006245 [Hypothenemus hampei]|uniref:RNA helicase n=1 Tax=Hypothenemus hampei TaxID=57062 RepID=A0ABD1EPV3_HYPHA
MPGCELIRCIPFRLLQQRGLALARPKVKRDSQLLISCKRSELNHYVGTVFNSLDEVPLASKGWNHSKSKNDHFTILPIISDQQSRETKQPFSNFQFDQRLVKVLESYNIKHATTFQSEAIPSVFQGDHTFLAAETGCGKTVSYLVPAIQRLITYQKNDCDTRLNSPRVVILVPNRELAFQVGELAQNLCQSVNLVANTLVGGRVKRIMLNPTFENVDVLVATPGVLGKLSTVGIYKLDSVENLILDEVDTLIDDSFIERMEGLLKRMSQAQLIFVAATLPKKLPDILTPYEESMQQIISPNIHKPLLNITQKFLRITRSVKPAHLLQILKSDKGSTVIFTNRNTTCKWLAMFLRENNIPCSNINGDMPPQIRTEQWNQFVEGETKILSATDVGSRGLNTIQINHVLNYDFPLYAADYIHRIGRVGRLGSPTNCTVTNFITSPEEIKLVQQIEVGIFSKGFNPIRWSRV